MRDHVTTERQMVLDAVFHWLKRAEKEGHATLLQPEVALDVRRLELCLEAGEERDQDEDEEDRDRDRDEVLRGRFLLGWLYWARCPAGSSEEELGAAFEASVESLKWCFIDGRYPVPEELRAAVADRAVPEVGRLSEEARALHDREAVKCAADLWERVVEATPDDSPAKNARTASYSMALHLRYLCTGAVPDLEEAVSSARRSLSGEPDDGEFLAELLGQLGAVLRTRYEHLARPEDAAEFLEVADRGLRLTPESHSSYGRWLADHGTGRLYRFARSQDADDIGAAKDAFRGALRVLPENGQRAAAERLLLLAEDAEHQGEDLRRTGGRLVTAEPTDQWRTSEDRPEDDILRLLSGVNQENFLLRGEQEDRRLQRAVDSGDPRVLSAALIERRQAVAATLVDHPARGSLLCGLGAALRGRYELTSGREDLATAVEVGRSSLLCRSFRGATRSSSLAELGVTLLVRAEVSGEEADADEAVTLLEQAVTGDPVHHWTNLGTALSARHRWSCREEDLDAAISATECALEMSDHYDPAPGPALSNLSGMLHSRYERSGDTTALERALRTARQALENDEHDASALLHLSNALRSRSKLSGSREDLDEAVGALFKTVGLLPHGHVDYGLYAGALSGALRSRFERMGDRDDIEKAVVAARSAMWATAKDTPARAARALEYALALLGRGEHTGNLDDMEEAVTLLRWALTVLPAEHPRRSNTLEALQTALLARHVRRPDPGDVDEAFALAESHAASFPKEREESAESTAALSSLAHAHARRYAVSRDASDLDAVIRIEHGLVESALRHGRPDLDHRQANLGTMLRVRFGLTGSPEDWAESARLLRESVSALPADDPRRAHRLWALGRVLIADSTGDRKLEAESLAALTEITRMSTAAPRLRIEAASLAGGREAARGLLDDSLERLAGSVDLLEFAVQQLPRTTRRELSLSDQMHAISRYAGLASKAAAAALDYQSKAELRYQRRYLRRSIWLLPLWAFLPRRWRPVLGGPPGPDPSDILELPQAPRHEERALGVLEHGRAVLLNQILETRPDLTELGREHPELAARFETLRSALDDAALEGPYGPVRTGKNRGEPSWESRSEERRSLATTFEEVLAQIRRQDGYAAFLAPPSTDELVEEAAQGPIVVFNISLLRSDALLLTPSGVRWIPLPDCAEKAVKQRAESFRRALSVVADGDESMRRRSEARAVLGEVLEWLWDAAAGPVLDALGFHGAPRPGEVWPRVWWVTGGLLGSLPLHAAGYHAAAAAGRGDRTVLDRVVSSYTPTVRALRQARRSLSAPPGQGKSLVAAVSVTPGARPLPHARDEAMHVGARVPEANVLLDAEATRANVMAHLADCTIAHFACHALSDGADPSKSSLLLHDHGSAPLTVAGLSPVILGSAQLAYLSACRTAVNESPELVDEAIHLTAAFQLAGFRHVVGTLWEVDDRFAAEQAEAFYAGLRDEAGNLDVEKAAYALNEVTRTARDRMPTSPSLWAAHLHAGA